MHPHVSWLGDIAANPRIANGTARLAVAIAGSADARGRYRGRALPLAVAAQLSSRHQKDHLDALVREGFLRVHRHQNGRVDVEIITPRDEAAPVSEKPFRALSGEVVGVTAPSKQTVTVYVESDASMMKLSINRASAEAIAQAISPQPA